MEVANFPIPDWVDCQAKPIHGLDLLGLRLPAQTIGVSLLSGVTTISPTIRYLSIRSWMIGAFELTGLPATKAAWEGFAESVESAIVLGNLLVSPEMAGLVGPGNAEPLIASGIDPLPLESLVVQNAYATYGGPSEALGLSLSLPTGLPALTFERGKPLADEVERALTGTQFRAILTETPTIKSLPRKVLLELGTRLPIDQVPAPEKLLLLDALLPAVPRTLRGSDERSRIASYSVMLELARLLGRVPSDLDFFENIARPDDRLPANLYQVLDGWACYAVRDCLAVAHEAVLNAIVRELGAPERNAAFVNASTALRTIMGRTEEIDQPLQALGLLAKDESYTELNFRELAARVERSTTPSRSQRGIRRWQGQLTEPVLRRLASGGDANSFGLLPVAWLLAERRIDPDSPFATEMIESISQRGWNRLGLRHVISPALEKWKREDWGLPEVVMQLARRTVDQHLHIAWTRFEADTKRDVALLIADGEHWYPRNSFRNGRLGSRLRQAVGWLRQLGLVDATGITQSGTTALTRAHDVLTRNLRES